MSGTKSDTDRTRPRAKHLALLLMAAGTLPALTGCALLDMLVQLLGDSSGSSAASGGTGSTGGTTAAGGSIPTGPQAPIDLQGIIASLMPPAPSAPPPPATSPAPTEPAPPPPTTSAAAPTPPPPTAQPTPSLTEIEESTASNGTGILRTVWENGGKQIGNAVLDEVPGGGIIKTGVGLANDGLNKLRGKGN